MSIQGVNSQTRPVQAFQTQDIGSARPAAQQQQQTDPLQALTKALEALEQAVSALTSRGFNNNQSVASQAGQNLGVSGGSQQSPFDFSSLFSGGSMFDQKAGGGAVANNPIYTPTYTPPVENNRPSFLDQKGGGPGGGNGNGPPQINFGNEKSGGGIRVGSDGANN